MAGPASKLGWKIVGGGAAAAAGVAANKAAQVAYKKTRRADPPINPAHPDTTWSEAVMWAVVSGIVIGLFKLAAERMAAQSWAKATGSLPPGMLAAKPTKE